MYEIPENLTYDCNDYVEIDIEALKEWESQMPVKLEKQLKKQAKKKGLKGTSADAYVFGALRKTGWKPSTQKKKKK